ncbi:unnamed protein product [Penicillium nalgiovense]|uniref:Trafficking protein particle complex subunit 6B n=1 Tax=Penicillium nalgiovense TaxID=60175 RepID=A0A9W4MPJ9_PENNA|nr:unnamed protein product [Penicillium nalgiovense]CAG7964764.1 unnamed protein product [Penicillium nalgiovense]CAG7969316.1 unnamed protein product [Penicillium nalgiovense]CAG8002288.1 unnamed protein product [Penicillium nalgiovense]CAG8018232.1 unnamed protein product [Penicillium nalgiovense]
MSFDSTSPLNTDPNARVFSSSCFDFLLIELVPMAERMAKELATEGKETEDEEVRETTFFRLESLGYRVGQGLAERFARDRPRFTDNLDVIKFLCKDLWTILFKKQVDNLKTNHRYLWFPCGIIRGALANLGINTTVQAETSDLPGATFQIKTLQPRP